MQYIDKGESGNLASQDRVDDTFGGALMVLNEKKQDKKKKQERYTSTEIILGKDARQIWRMLYRP